jgi:hypothetical protein
MITYTENDFTASVGKYGRDGRPCYNTIKDQEIVQYLLNRIPAEYGGGDGKLHSALLWGRTSNELQQAIERFQKVHAIDEGLYTDGHIDPHDRTIRALLKYAYHRLYQWADDTPHPQDTPPKPEALPTSGVKLTNEWEFGVTADFGTSINLPNGVQLPLPERGRIWPKRETKITVRRIIDKDGTIEYDVFLGPHDARSTPGVHAAEKLGVSKVEGMGPSFAAKGGLWMLSKPVSAGGGSVLAVLIPTIGGAEKIWQFHTTEGSARCVVNGITNF